MYAVMTWGDKMPSTFPISTPQNSGNMVHAQAPFSMFKNTIGMHYGFESEGYPTFHDFVNDRCKAVIIPFANTIRTDPKHDERGASLASSLSKFTVPIIPFGLGAQAESTDSANLNLGPGMVSFIRALSEKSPAISVRGDFTAAILAKYGSSENVYNTGCPSYYSRPEAFGNLKKTLATGQGPSEISFSGSLHHLAEHKALLYKSIFEDTFLIEPVNAKLHQFYIETIREHANAEPPYFFAALLQDPSCSTNELRKHIEKRYRLFRDLDSWISFNQESTDGSIGTRFHVNMASLLSGVPATWIVHDSRTVELCDRLSLPNVSMTAATQEPYRHIIQESDYAPLFRNLNENFRYFDKFLAAADLPPISKPSI